MKKILLLFSLIMLIPNVYANDIKSIYMDIFIDSSGNAHVSETWNTELTSGTEGYKPYYNLGDSKIIDYNVILNNTEEYTFLENWNVDSSFLEKRYKYGINYLDDGVELCFGISKYGSNSYTMSYTITNFVKSTTDADMIYFNLVPSNLSDKPEYTYIKIYSDNKYSDDLDVWGYGNYGGLAYVHDGYIEMIHEDSLNSDEYMTILVKFPKGTYNTLSNLDNDFEYYYNMAEKGKTSYKQNSNSFNVKVILFSLALLVISLLFSIFWIFILSKILLIFSKLFSKIKMKLHLNISFGNLNVKVTKDSKDFPKKDYFREIPFGTDIEKAYWVSGFYNLIKNKNDYLGAILLKWLKNGNIENITITSKILKKDEKALKLITSNNLEKNELKLYNMINEASIDGVLEKNEFINWCRIHYNKILAWFDDVIDDTSIRFVNEGLLTKIDNKIIPSLKMKDYAYKMTSLKNFLNDFTLINERKAIEVKIWNEYLMYAQIFGISKKVIKEFKEMYPDVIPSDFYEDIVFLQTISYEGIYFAESKKSFMDISTAYSSGGGGRSSGGGGRSSGGGGTGSFGGGSGGGGFR